MCTRDAWCPGLFQVSSSFQWLELGNMYFKDKIPETLKLFQWQEFLYNFKNLLHVCATPGKKKKKGLWSWWTLTIIHLFHLMYVHAKFLQLCLTLCDSMYHSSPGSSVHWILREKILVCVSVWPRDQTYITYVYLHWQVGSLLLVPPGKSCFIL